MNEQVNDMVKSKRYSRFNGIRAPRERGVTIQYGMYERECVLQFSGIKAPQHGGCYNLSMTKEYYV